MSTGGDETIAGLRAALELTPDNAPLRKVLAETLLRYGRLAEAEREFREGISLAPGDASLKVGLARVYLQQGNASRALVVLEGVVGEAGPRGPEAAVRVLYARALLKAGEPDRARRQFRMAVESDPAAADPALAEELGVGAGAAGTAGDEDERVRVDAFSREVSPAAERPGFEMERPDVTFAGVGGMEGVKDEIRLKIIHPLTRPELYQAYGKKIGGGILLYGPPGCGKTHLARATAGEVKARFMAVGISDILNMYLGQSERNLHELFEQARENRPCVLFFDEVDALAASRSDLRQSAGRQLVNQFLSELDGVDSSNEGLLILAATNAPWHLDAAFRRPGRFDRIIFVPPPDAPARAEILKLLLAGKPTDMVDAEAVAKKTDGFSGADLKAAVDVAIEGKLREAMRRPGADPGPLRTKDLLEAARSLKPTTKEWFSTAKNHALYANQGGMYDTVLEYMGIRR